jgi:hypothetical protein
MNGQDFASIDLLEDYYRGPAYAEFSDTPTETIDVATVHTDAMARSGSFRVSGFQAAGFHQLLNAVPIPAMLVDQSYSVIFANESSEKINIFLPVSPAQ